MMIGKNKLTLNHAAMAAVVQAWVDRTFPAGIAPRVEGVRFSGDEFIIVLTQAEPVKPKLPNVPTVPAPEELDG